MAFASYAELIVEVAEWLDNTSLAARIPAFVALCEADMNRKLRVPRMIQRDTANIGTDNSFSAVPSNYLDVILYELSDGINIWRLDPAPIELIADYRAGSDAPGRPRVFGVNGTDTGREFEHYPTPDRTYVGTLTYYGKPLALNSVVTATPPVNVTTNWILQEAPDAYLYGTLLQAAPYLRDNEQARVWSDGYANALQGLKGAERRLAGKLRTDMAGLVGRRSYDITRG